MAAHAAQHVGFSLAATYDWMMTVARGRSRRSEWVTRDDEPLSEDMIILTAAVTSVSTIVTKLLEIFLVLMKEIINFM